MYSPKRRFRLFRSPAFAPQGPAFVIGNATLGVDYTITNDGTRDYYNFLTTGKTMTVTTTAPQTVDYFALGGGGGGGNGGGGAGGLQRATSYSLPAGTYNVVIGGGGTPNTNGANTLFGSIVTSLGGGAGGNGNANGVNGGCGGGGGNNNAGGIGSQGFNGGSGVTGALSAGGGGGGVGGAGQGSSVSVAGGIGITYNNGTLLQVGGGGGGYAFSSGTAFPGTFGGGNGGFGNLNRNGQNGMANTGGGGGGTGGQIAGTGGSGIFILNVA